MARIYNSDLTKELIEAAKIQTSFDKTPVEIADKVVPVMEVNPKLLRRSRILGSILNRTTTASNVAIVASSDYTNRKVFITGCCFTNTQDATSDNVDGSVSIIQDGATKYIPLWKKQTTTAGDKYGTHSFETPLAIDLNSAVSLTATFTAGTSSTSITIMGYVEDASRA